ncbi:MAG: HEAT repeat domain-containing protein [Nitrospirae bacterium]|nr:MAG: HEAT repeat domain-containing protein [Nitrospirota bacterium]
MKTWLPIFTILALILCLTPPDTDARRTHLSAEQKAKLEKVQTVYVNVLALTERGRRDPAPLLAIVKQRLEELGYTVVTDRQQPHDVEFKVKCEERKTWTGTTRAGGDAELPDAPARLWKGPACLFTYYLDGQDLGWYKEVRTPFEDALAAAKAVGVSDAGQYALDQLAEQLKTYDFPVAVTAEWGQIDRLLALLNDPSTHKVRKLKILSVLSQMNADEALPRLTEFLKDKDLEQEAITALAGAGAESIPILIDLFRTATQPEIKAAAAKTLGHVAATTSDPRTIPPLLEYLKHTLTRIRTSEDIDFPVLTEVVWALGKLRDERSIEPMAKLQEKIWLIHDNSEEMQALREATNWTYKQLDLDGHLS